MTKSKKNLKSSKYSKSTKNMFSEHLSEPWFSLVSLGLKTVEGRKNKGKWTELKVGDTIQWFNEDFLERKVKTIIKNKRIYPSFKDYLENEGLDKCLPGFSSIEHGLSVYYKYYSKEDEVLYGVVAFELQII